MAAKEILLFSSSQSRDISLYPSGNSYTLFLSSPVRNIERVDLVSARVPNSMYNLVNGTDVLTLGASTVSLNPGFYGVYDLATALTNAGTGLGVTVTYLTFEGKFIFSSSSSFGIKVNSAQLSNLLGIPMTDSAIQAAQAGSTWPTYANKYILTSNNVVNASVSEQIFLDIDELRTPRHVFTGGLQYEKRGSYVTQLTSGAGPSRAFAPLTLDVNSGCIKNFHENKDYKISVFYPEPINKLQRLTVSWLDINGQPLAFNGLEQNSFILRLHVRATVAEYKSILALPPPVPMDPGPNMTIVGALLLGGLLLILFVKNSRNE